MRVAVTGATGFLGSHLARGLAEAGHRVVAVVRSPERARWIEGLGGEVRQADLRDRASLERALAGVDALVSNAALAAERESDDPEAFAAADALATANVVDATLAAGVARMVHLSSVAVYRVRWLHARVRADHPRRGAGWDLLRLATRPGYADAKARSEEVVWAAVARGLQPTVLRPGPIYGSGDEKLLTRYLRAMEGRLRLVPTVRIPHVHAGDVARAAVGALANPASVGRAYNVTGEGESLAEVIRAIRDVRGRGPWVIPIPVPLGLGWDNQPARDELGVRFRSLRDGLREALGTPELQGVPLVEPRR